MQIYSQQENRGKFMAIFLERFALLTLLEPLQQSLLYHKFSFNDYTIINLQRINGSSTMFINKRRNWGRQQKLFCN